MTEISKIAIVGAGSLRGREIAEALSDSPFGGADFLLMDDEADLGALEAVGDEVTFIQRIEAHSFDRTSFAFFTGDEALTRKHWQAAHKAGASVIDVSGALEGERGVLIRAPWVSEESQSGQPAPTLETRAVVPAQAAAVALALLLERIASAGHVRSASATILEPASEFGRSAMDELHQQTVKLLSFQDLPKQVYDTQVAFNATPVFGENARFSLAASESRIRRHLALLAAPQLPEIGVQLIHAPVFHGYGISLAVELTHAVTLDQAEAALAGEHVEIVTADGDPPTNVSVAGQPDILVRVRTQGALKSEEKATHFWIWAGFDNLRFASLNAVACAIELNRLRPQGEVQ